MFAQLLPVLTPVFAAIFIGWAWVRSGRAFDTPMFSELMTLVGTPCLVFYTLSGLEVAPALLGRLGLAAALALLLTGVLAVPLLYLTRSPVRGVLPAVLFGNTGNIGLPLSLFAFGEQGLGLAMVVFLVGSVAMFTVGVGLYSGQGVLRLLLRSPLIYAVLLALPFVLGPWTVPPALANTTRLIGQFTIPLMLITLGVSLARLRVAHVPLALGVSVLRLGVGLLAGLLVGRGLGLQGAALSVLVLQSAMPVAVFNYLFAQRYQRYAEETAGAVVLSTALALLILPFLLAWLMP